MSSAGFRPNGLSREVDRLAKPFSNSEQQPAFTLEEDGENYRVLLDAARRAALEIVKSPSGVLTGAASYIHRASRELLAHVDESDGPTREPDGSIFQCLERVRDVWPDLAAGKIEGEQVFSGEPGLWKCAMTEWPMGTFARMAADFMIDRGALGGNVLELGAGVGSCSALVAAHVSRGFIRTDLQPFLLKRQKIAGTVERYDFNEPGRWRGLDTIFAVNALHCARNKGATLRYLAEMLREGGLLVLGEGRPHTDDRGTPWALNPFFGLFRGWWDIGGFVPREEWVAAFEGAGFSNIGYAVRRADEHDLGGVIWGMK